MELRYKPEKSEIDQIGNITGTTLQISTRWPAFPNRLIISWNPSAPFFHDVKWRYGFIQIPTVT